MSLPSVRLFLCLAPVRPCVSGPLCLVVRCVFEKAQGWAEAPEELGVYLFTGVTFEEKDASVGRARAAASGRDELGRRRSRRRWPRLTGLRDRRARRCDSTSCGALATTRGARRHPSPGRMGLAMLGIIQGERSECADGARLHHLGECDSDPLLNHHAALAQLIAGHAVNRADAIEHRHWSSCSWSGRARMRKR